MASVNQTRPYYENQMGKTHYKPLAARHGRETAWARHVMCESDVRVPTYHHVVLVNQWRFKSTQSQHLNAARSFIYLPTAWFGCSIQPSSGRQHKYI